MDCNLSAEANSNSSSRSLTALGALGVGHQASGTELALLACMHVEVHVFQLAAAGLAGHVLPASGLAAAVPAELSASGAQAVCRQEGRQGGGLLASVALGQALAVGVSEERVQERPKCHALGGCAGGLGFLGCAEQQA